MKLELKPVKSDEKEILKNLLGTVYLMNGEVNSDEK